MGIGEEQYFVRMEDFIGIDTSYPVTHVALARNRILTIKEYPHDTDYSWTPIGYDITVKNILSGEEKKIAQIDIPFVYAVSDGNTFYLVSQDASPSEKNKYTTRIGMIDSETNDIVWLADMSMQEEFPEEYSDFIISDNRLFMIAENQVLTLELENSALTLLYSTQEEINNHIASNHAFIFEDELYLSKHNNEICAVNIHSGEERRLEMDYGKMENRNYFDRTGMYRYFRFKDELYFRRDLTRGLYAYNLRTGKERCATEYNFYLIAVGSDGLYVGEEGDRQNFYFFNPDTGEIHSVNDVKTDPYKKTPLYDSLFEELYRLEFAG